MVWDTLTTPLPTSLIDFCAQQRSQKHPDGHNLGLCEPSGRAKGDVFPLPHFSPPQSNINRRLCRTPAHSPLVTRCFGAGYGWGRVFPLLFIATSEGFKQRLKGSLSREGRADRARAVDAGIQQHPAQVLRLLLAPLEHRERFTVGDHLNQPLNLCSAVLWLGFPAGPCSGGVQNITLQPQNLPTSREMGDEMQKEIFKTKGIAEPASPQGIITFFRGVALY